jgi:hypothetical protein
MRISIDTLEILSYLSFEAAQASVYAGILSTCTEIGTEVGVFYFSADDSFEVCLVDAAR